MINLLPAHSIYVCARTRIIVFSKKFSFPSMYYQAVNNWGLQGWFSSREKRCNPKLIFLSTARYSWEAGEKKSHFLVCTTFMIMIYKCWRSRYFPAAMSHARTELKAQLSIFWIFSQCVAKIWLNPVAAILGLLHLIGPILGSKAGYGWSYSLS